jgi:methylglutaconyl-CoA hydratase
MYKTINECSKPVLGVIHGYAIGGGFGLCTVCDIVIADEKTIFSLSEVLIGIIPAVIGPYTERKIGNSWWRALGISGERFDAPFAEKIGLVHYSVPKIEMDNMIKHVIQQLMKGGPISQSIFKEYIRNMDQLNSTDVIANVRSSPEGQEGLAAFLEKRKPNWNQK